VAVGHDGTAPLLLLSGLSHHSKALALDPAASLLVGEPGERGDPLTHPRLTLLGRVERADKAALRDLWLRDHPKSKLYYDLGDFALWRLAVRAAHLNGGFGRAYVLAPGDLVELPEGRA
jgi:heme iron utilization protein